MTPPASCSGDMYAGVPTISESRRVGEVSGGGRGPGATGPSVRCGDPVGAFASSGGRSCVERARPKSLTRTRPSRPISTLSGLKSRCTIPAPCAASSPRPAATKTSRISSSARGRSRSQERSVPPSTSSIATKSWPCTSAASNTETTLGWESRAIACASRKSRACSSPLPMPSRASVRSTLIATRRFSSGSCAT